MSLNKVCKKIVKPVWDSYARRMRSMIREEIILADNKTEDIRQALKSERTDRLELYDTATGKYWLPADAAGDMIAQEIKANRIFDEAIFNTACRFIKPNSVCLDVGSNFGQMAVLISKFMAEISEPDSYEVHAFEAEPFVYKILKKNIKENNSRIIPHNVAVYHKSNEVLYFPEIDFVEHQTYGSYGFDLSRISGGG